MEQIRSFIAIVLPDEVRSALAELQAVLQTDKPPQVKWVDPQGIHLTLKFLGNITRARIGDVVAAIEQASKGFSSLTLEVKGLGVFPNLQRVRVLWVGVGGDIKQLKQLQRHIDSCLVPLGFAQESRSFTPHLTLARVREMATAKEQQSFGQLVESTVFEASPRFTAESISLMQSQLNSDGAIYRQIATIDLN